MNYLPCFIILIPIFTLWESHTAVREILKHPFNKSSGSKMFCAVCKKKRWRTLFKIITLCDLWAFFSAFWPRRKASRVCVPKSSHSECRDSLLYQFTLGVIEMCLASPMNFTRKPPRLTLNEFNGENSFQEREKFENSLSSLCTALECINFSPTRPTRNKHFRLLIFRAEIKRSERISICFFLVRRLRHSLDKFMRNHLKWVS